jgi:hypothetical protein
MLTISPVISMGINALLAALTAIGASSTSDPTTSKIVLWAGTISSAVNILLHAASSAQAGPIATAPPK